jgi:hypothetical protein
MYRGDMSPVIEFDSSTPEQKLAEGATWKLDYGQIEGALQGSLEIAENVFARCAKHHFRKLLGDKVRLGELDASIPSPYWVMGTSVILLLDNGKLDTNQLEVTTQALATAVLQLRGEKPIRLLGALNPKISQVGVGLLKFSLQQRWCLDG